MWVTSSSACIVCGSGTNKTSVCKGSFYVFLYIGPAKPWGSGIKSLSAIFCVNSGLCLFPCFYTWPSTDTVDELSFISAAPWSLYLASLHINISCSLPSLNTHHKLPLPLSLSSSFKQPLAILDTFKTYFCTAWQYSCLLCFPLKCSHRVGLIFFFLNSNTPCSKSCLFLLFSLSSIDLACKCGTALLVVDLSPQFSRGTLELQS